MTRGRHAVALSLVVVILVSAWGYAIVHADVQNFAVVVEVVNHVSFTVQNATIWVEEESMPAVTREQVSISQQPVEVASSIGPGQTAQGTLSIAVQETSGSVDLPITLGWQTSRDGEYPFYLTKHVTLDLSAAETHVTFHVDETSCTRRLVGIGPVLSGPPTYEIRGTTPGTIGLQGSGASPAIPLAYVLVMDSIWSSISDKVWRYTSDLSATYSTTVWTYSGNSIYEVKDWLVSEWTQHSNLVGCLFVGDVPEAWYEIADHPGWAAETFPIDLYYMDLNGIWADLDGNGVFDYHFHNKAPEIWIGRLKASNIGNEVQLIANYFDKDHAYRTGTLSPPHRALSYVDDDWKDSYDRAAVGEVYPDTTVVNDGATTTATDYKNRLALGYEWVHLMCHGWPGGHTFKIGPDWTGGTAYSDEYLSSDWPVLFFNFFVCSGARYTESGYLAGSAIFTTNHGLLAVGSTKTGSMTNFFEFYRPLASGKSMGAALMAWWTTYMYSDWFTDWSYGLSIIGDPTLTITTGVEPYAASIIGIMVTPDSSNVGQGSKIIYTISVRNTGTNDISSAKVQVKIYRPDGSLASSPYRSVNSFKVGTERTVEVTYTLSSSAPLGYWTYGVYVYRGSTLLDQVTDQGFTVQPAVKTGQILSVTADPDPVGAGGATAFTVTFRNTGNVIWSTAKLTAKIYKPDSTTVYATRTLTVRKIAPNVEYSYQVKWTPSSFASLGTYTYSVDLIYKSTVLDSSIGNTVKVEPIVKTGEITSVTDAPDPLTRPGTVTFTVTVKNTGNTIWSSAKIKVKIYKPDGTTLYATKSLRISNLTPSVEYTYDIKWAVSSTATTGTYTYDVYFYYGTSTLMDSDVGNPSNTITIN